MTKPDQHSVAEMVTSDIISVLDELRQHPQVKELKMIRDEVVIDFDKSEQPTKELRATLRKIGMRPWSIS